LFRCLLIGVLAIDFMEIPGTQGAEQSGVSRLSSKMSVSIHVPMAPS
jgi:hypothetical protein